MLIAAAGARRHPREPGHGEEVAQQAVGRQEVEVGEADVRRAQGQPQGVCCICTASPTLNCSHMQALHTNGRSHAMFTAVIEVHSCPRVCALPQSDFIIFSVLTLGICSIAQRKLEALQEAGGEREQSEEEEDE